MNVGGILSNARLDGVSIGPGSRAGLLSIEGPELAIQKWRAIVRDHKTEILAALAPVQFGELVTVSQWRGSPEEVLAEGGCLVQIELKDKIPHCEQQEQESPPPRLMLGYEFKGPINLDDIAGPFKNERRRREGRL